jgi:hypothetical protein
MSDLTKAALPVVELFAALLLVGLVAALNALHWGWKRRRGGDPGRKFRSSNFSRVLVAVLVFSYIPVLRQAVSLLQCEDVGERRLLRQYPSVSCASRGYLAWKAASWLLASAMFLGGVAFIALYGQARYRLYRRLTPDELKRQKELPEVRALVKDIEVRFGFQFTSYGRPAASTLLDRACASWEALVLVRSSLFVVCAALVDDFRTRFSLLSTVATLFLLLHLAVQPSSSARSSRLETASLATLASIGWVNSYGWSDGTVPEVIASLLFYGFLAVALARAVWLAWKEGWFTQSVARARSRLDSARAGMQQLRNRFRSSAASADSRASLDDGGGVRPPAADDAGARASGAGTSASIAS